MLTAHRSHRMDSGRFESFNKVRRLISVRSLSVPTHRHLQPYVFHQVMESLFTPLRLDTDSRRLKFETYLDRSIDEVRTLLVGTVDLGLPLDRRQVAGRAFMAAMEQDENEILENFIDYGGVVVGDENRLKQIITNLAGYIHRLSSQHSV